MSMVRVTSLSRPTAVLKRVSMCLGLNAKLYRVSDYFTGFFWNCGFILIDGSNLTNFSFFLE